MHKTNSVSLALLACFTFLSAAPAWATDTQDQKNTLRLQLERVSLYAETNKIDKAFSLLDQLKAQYPNNPQVLQAEADLNARIGNQGAAFAALDKALTIDPQNEDILDQQRTIDQNPFTSGGYTFRHTNESTEQFGIFASQFTLAPSVSAEINLQDDHLKSRHPVTRVNGATKNYSGDWQRGTLTLDKTFSSGDQASGFLFANDHTPGIGGRYSLWDHTGATTLQANLRKPDWDYVQLVTEDGTQDSIHLERKQFVTNHLQVTLGGGFNNYNLKGDSDVARAGAWNLNVAYTHPYSFSGKPGDDVMLGAYYTVDAEYFTHRDERPAIGGGVFMPLPVSSYEIHALNVSAAKDLSSKLHVEGYGGYAIDRLGSSGPVFGASAVYALTDRLGIELRGSQTMLGGQNNNNNEAESLVGINLKWRW